MTDESDPIADAPTTPRRRGRAALVAVVAVLALVGAAAAGLVYGRATAPGPDIVVQPEPVTEKPPAVDPMPVGTLPSVAPSPSATPTPSASASPSVPSVPSLTVGSTTGPARWPVTLTAGPGLGDAGTIASGYRLTTAGISGPQVAGVLAGTFGVTGSPKPEAGAWVVGSSGGPTLTVNNDPLLSWVFEDPQALASPATGEQLDPGRAVELATALLGSIGVDTSSVDWQVDRYFGRTSVTAWQLIAGARTQLAWQVAFDPSGALVRASGFSAGVEEVTGYPVVGAATAVTRSATAPWSAIGPSPLSGPSGDPSSSSPSPSATGPTPAPGRPAVTVPVTDVTITGATLALAQYWQPDGSLLMLPAYTLTGSDGSRWSLLAVDEPYVQFVDQPYPLASVAAS